MAEISSGIRQATRRGSFDPVRELTAAPGPGQPTRSSPMP